MESKTESQVAYPEAFQAYGLDKSLLKALAKFGWTEPSEIQAEMIPVAMAGKDILGQARTGTGKTGAFALPILQRLIANKPDGPNKRVRCLVLAPTRELAAQVAGEFRELAKFTGFKVMVAYGGTQVRQQAVELKNHPEIVVGTPGRIMDLMNRKWLRVDKLDYAVLDEVDRMLDIGFRDDIRKILGKVTSKHQTLFVSATLDDEINRLARRYMTDPTEILLAPDRMTVEGVDQVYIAVKPWDKRRMLLAAIRQLDPSLAIVFIRTKRETDKVAKYLVDKGIKAKQIHGDLYQSKREKVMSRFRKGEITVLVATDLASRGLDVDDITHIINYDIPENPDAYVHRIGRTARMGGKGLAVTLVTPEQGAELTEIEKYINLEIPTMEVEGFKESQTPEKFQAPKESPKPKVLSRGEASVFGKSVEDAPVRKRTLGGKFPPRRKRRL